jgi:flagellar protein FlaG
MSVEISTVAISHAVSAAKGASMAHESHTAGQDSVAVQQVLNEKAARVVVANTDPQVKSEEVSVEALKAAAVAGNAFLSSANRNLQFQIDSETKQVVVKIVDSKTGELVRQIPTVEMLDFIRHMKSLEGSAGSILKGEA